MVYNSGFWVSGARVGGCLTPVPSPCAATLKVRVERLDSGFRVKG